MNTKYLLLASFFMVLVGACSIKGSMQGLVSYQKKTKKENPQLLHHPKADENICSYTNNDVHKVLITNGKVVKSCMSDQDRSIVYNWGVKCKSEICYPLQAVQAACAEKNMPVYIVAEYYDGPMMSKAYTLERPILGIDVKYYKTNFTSKYTSKFYKDLGVGDANIKRFCYFERGIFIKSYNSIDSIGM